MSSPRPPGEPTAPTLHYAGRTPFVAYTNADALHDLVRTNTDEPLEATFVVVTQIMELHFELLRRDWLLAIDHLTAGEVGEAIAVLNRSGTTQTSLIGTWGMLEPMSPVQYNRFRGALGKASGFQSFGYREIEFLVGAKDEHMLRPHVEMPEVAARLQTLFDGPSLYDSALSALAARGLPVPADVLTRERQLAYVDSDPRIVDVWREVYESGGELAELAELAEALIGVASRHTHWRFVHYTAVRRILGAKPGTGGSAGLAWLKRATDTMLFPELWEVRGVL